MPPYHLRIYAREGYYVFINYLWNMHVGFNEKIPTDDENFLLECELVRDATTVEYSFHPQCTASLHRRISFVQLI